MPTGYTFKISDNDISFKDFIFECSREFIRTNDENDNLKEIDEIKPLLFYKRRLLDTRKALKNSKKMSPEDIFKLYNDEYTRRIKHLINLQILKTKYENMLFKVKRWIPPTEKHVELKKFMIQQLELSIDSDCFLINDSDYLNISFDDWNKNRMENLKNSVEFAEKKYKENLKMCKIKTKWLQDLKKSLED